MLRLTKADPRFETVQALQQMLCYLKNPTVHFNINALRTIVPDVEWTVDRASACEQIEQVLQDIISGTPLLRTLN